MGGEISVGAMQYLITFLEGIISFISPCMLPLIPLYVTYFAGGVEKREETGKLKVFFRALMFVAGFTLVFSLLGLFAGTVGALLVNYRIIVNVITGAIVIIFGLSYLEIIHLPFLKGMKGGNKADSLVSAFVFGIIYSVSLTPCIGAFLGSALMLASTSAGALRGVLLLITYSLGLGIPFIISALILDRLEVAFNFIKRHYRVINVICGIFLIVIGVLMMCGVLSSFMAVLR